MGETAKGNLDSTALLREPHCCLGLPSAVVSPMASKQRFGGVPAFFFVLRLDMGKGRDKKKASSGKGNSAKTKGKEALKAQAKAKKDSEWEGIIKTPAPLFINFVH